MWFVIHKSLAKFWPIWGGMFWTVFEEEGIKIRIWVPRKNFVRSWRYVGMRQVKSWADVFEAERVADCAEVPKRGDWTVRGSDRRPCKQGGERGGTIWCEAGKPLKGFKQEQHVRSSLHFLNIVLAALVRKLEREQSKAGESKQRKVAQRGTGGSADKEKWHTGTW